MEVVIRFPDNYDSTKQYPTLLHLHGAGFRYSSREKLERSAFFTNTAEHVNDLGIITVSPICSEDTWFNLMGELHELLRTLSELPYVDNDRIYIMGCSMGGYGTWILAMCYPEYFAAMVPICGGGMSWNIARYKNIPIWAHHGALDDVVPLNESEKMVEAAKKAGCDVRFTVYPDILHASWIPVYRSREVFEWLLSKKRSSTETKALQYDDGVKYG